MDTRATVERAQGGDRAAREEIARAWLRPAYGAALAVLRRAADAEDAVQEGFLRAFAALARLEDPGAFGPWLLAIVRNAARDRRRRRPVRPLAEEPAVGDDPPAEARSVWARLPETERLVTWLKVSEGMTFREIADLLCVSKSAVDRTWRRALARLRKETTRC